MTKVEVLFQNLQSHENTKFTLCPGVNFILADGNNVGKSTIFKVLSRIAKAPNISSSKLLSLIRFGCNEATAAFKFNGEAVIARFTKYDREAAKVFFEHVHSDGEVTRTVYCPKCLLEALGIVVGENGELINFNDANSVQLISEISPEADTIITHVMLDQNVEHIKRNIYSLGREVNLDIKRLGAQVEAYENTLAELVYSPAVDEFFEQKETLEVLCKVCDSIPSITTAKQSLPSSADMELCRHILDVLRNMEGYVSRPSHEVVSDVGEYSKILEATKLLNTAVKAISYLDRTRNVVSDVSNLKIMCSLTSRFLSVVRNIEAVRSSTLRLATLYKEREELIETLSANSVLVDCPVHGKVYYTDEKCVPYST